MPKIRDAASAQAVLNYWMDVEALTPSVLEKDDGQDRSVRTHLVTARSNAIDWTMGKQERRELERVINVVRVGLFKTGEAAAAIASALGVSPDEVFDGKGDGRDGFLAAFAVGADGRPVRGSLKVTLFAMRFEALGRGTLPRTHYDRRQNEIGEAFDTAWAAESAPPLDVGSLRSVSEWVAGELGRTPPLSLAKSSAAFASVTQRLRYGEDDDPVGIVDSFLYADLNRVVDAVRGGRWGAALAEYLEPHDLDESMKRDADRLDTVAATLAIDEVPVGKWPSRGRGGHPLVLRQQMAVNAALAMRDGGLFSVNGPPGTGKSTLLRDVIAAVFVNRAVAMCGFRKPADAFKKMDPVVVGRRAPPVWELDPRLSDHGILVCSSNNTAVENITKELPDLKSIADSYRAAPAALDRIAFFQDVARAIAPKGQEVWGLASAALGNGANRSFFVNRYWPTDDTSRNEILKDARITWMADPKPAKGGRYVFAYVMAEGTKHSIKAFGQPAEALAALLPDVKGRRGVTVTLVGTREEDEFVRKGKDGVEQVETESYLRVSKVNPPAEAATGVRDVILGPCARMDWERTVAAFRKAEERVALLVKATRVIAEAPAEIERTRRASEAAEADLRRAEETFVTAMGALGDVAFEREQAEKERHSAFQRSSLALADRPGFFARLFRTASAKEWQARIAALRIEVEAAEQAYREGEADYQRFAAAGKAAEDARARAERALDEAAAAVEAARERLRKARSNFVQEPLSLAAVFGMEREEREQAAVWVSEELDLAREELFAAAVQVHLAFLGGASGRVVDNLRLFVDALRGDRDVAEARPRVGRHLWNTFFMTVPVISSTFASVGRMFSDDFGPGELGWLLIDEAGQAPPQAAVGAIWRARRAVVVGDPKQVEPVVTIPGKVSALLYRQHKVPNIGFDVRVGSVQTVSDRRNSLGAYIGGPDGTWVGCPLRVHRRCHDPMFSISNAISYAGSMVLGKPPLDTDAWRGDIPDFGPGGHPSAWFDLRVPSEPEGNWVPGQGAYAMRLLERMVEQREAAGRLVDGKGKSLRGRYLRDDGMPEAFVITPFRTVAQSMRRLLISRADVFRRLDPAIDKATVEAWAKTHIGTVHTFQGKEAETVLLVLGGSAARPGAVAWAGKTPNILNVAATRAKSSFYVVGDLSLWSGTAVFREAASRLETVTVPDFVALAPDPNRVERIDTLDGHLRVLADAFGRAQRRVAISSPYLTDRAIQDDRCDVLAMARQATARGVQVTVYVDPALNGGDTPKSGFLRAVDLLGAAGAEVAFVNRVHAKTLCVDDAEIAEGSFNWLSAVRDEDSAYQRLEASFRYTGRDAARFVTKALSRLDGARMAKQQVLAEA
ncbi:AAA domain-containing protein [Azospirillum sp.]|uniref:AAA domain-containing protein n=1 Tax=Azospirillum sp. TaxID=34012 RepID=UPI003D703CD0